VLGCPFAFQHREAKRIDRTGPATARNVAGLQQGDARAEARRQGDGVGPGAFGLRRAIQGTRIWRYVGAAIV
jgi:hypothetical protein